MLWVELFDLIPESSSDPNTTLQAIVMIALCSDRQARDDDTLPEGDDRGGWWADPTFGSRLWLARRSPNTPETELKVQEYAKEALQVLVDEGICGAFQVETARDGNALGMVVTLYRDGEQPAIVQFDDLWAAMGG